VLDGLDPGENGTTDRLAGGGVGRHRDAGGGRFVDDGSEFFLRKGRGGGAAGASAIIGIDFDPIGTCGDLFTGLLAHPWQWLRDADRMAR